MRWGLALLLLLPLGWRVFRDPRAITERWPHLALLGLLGVGSYNALQYMAVQTSTALNVTLIAASSPVWMLLVGLVFYGERPSPRAMAGAVLSLLGVLLVISRGSLQTLLQVRLVPGDLYILLAIALWAGYSWLLARPPASMRPGRRPDWDWAEFLLVQVVFGAGFAAAGGGCRVGRAARAHRVDAVGGARAGLPGRWPVDPRLPLLGARRGHGGASGGSFLYQSHASVRGADVGRGAGRGAALVPRRRVRAHRRRHPRVGAAPTGRGRPNRIRRCLGKRRRRSGCSGP